MQKKLTITIDEKVYEGLHAVIGRRRISRFIEDLVRPYVLYHELKAAYRLSVADAWIAALAKERGATLVHKDPEFEQVEAVLEVLKLPYKVGS